MGWIGKVGGAALAVTLAWAGAAHAIVSTSAPASLTGAGVSFLDGVAMLSITRTDTSVGCSGSLVGGGAYILTAAHCVSGNSGMASATAISISLLGGSVTASSASYVVNPGWNGTLTAGNDLAVIRLSTPITGVASYDLYTSASAQGSTIVLAGYGYTGTGATGAVNGSFGTLRYGYNQYDSPNNAGYTATYLFDFDSGSSSPQINQFGSTGLGGSEAMIASGDSGGPSLLQVNGTWMVVGVHSSEGCTSRQSCPVNSSFGETGADISIYGNAAWLQSVIVAVPEPQAFAMLALGLAVVGGFARRRQRAG